MDAWLVYRLTGGASLVTDHTNASRTLLYNIESKSWDDDLLELFGVPRASLPHVVPSSGVVGHASGDLVGADIPVAGIAGDQQAALFGQACWEPGMAKNTYGTGAFVLLHIGPNRPPAAEDTGVLTTIACDAEGQPNYALEGSIFIAGAAVQWLRDGLKIVTKATDTAAIAQSVEDTGGVYFVPALVGLGAPHWEADARGTIVGVTRGTTRAHIVRAALEAMAYSSRDVVEAMAKASGVTLASLRVDGGAAANDWLMQFQADVLGVPVERPDLVETTALGAAGLAGIATGVWKGGADFAKRRALTRFDPCTEREEAYVGWRRAADTVLYWARYGRS